VVRSVRRRRQGRLRSALRLSVSEIEGTLDHGEVRRLSQQSLVAGHETTASLISLMLHRLQVLFASANCDEAVWERPDDIELDRFGSGARPHPAFGWGVHHCIGNALARREGELALRWIVERFEAVEQIGPVAVNEPFILRGLTTLPIRWTVRR